MSKNNKKWFGQNIKGSKGYRRNMNIRHLYFSSSKSPVFLWFGKFFFFWHYRVFLSFFKLFAFFNKQENLKKFIVFNFVNHIFLIKLEDSNRKKKRIMVKKKEAVFQQNRLLWFMASKNLEEDDTFVLEKN